MRILEVLKVTKHFGGLVALQDVDFQIEARELVGLIGPNGAGKTTLFNVLSGVIRPTRGRVVFQGEDIAGIKPHLIAEKGLIRTFQATKLFMELSVLENVHIACHILASRNLFGDMVGLPSIRKRENDLKQRAHGIIELAGLGAMTEELAKNLPHGYQRALGVAIALATGPKLLCLDEPLTGMNIEETRFMVHLIEKIRSEGTTVLLVEHDMKVVMNICDRIIVLNFGRKIAEGRPEEVQSNKEVVEAYLGGAEEDVA